MSLASSPAVPNGVTASPLRGYLAALVGVGIWAGWTVFTRADMRGQMAVTDLVALRFATAGLLLLPVLLRRGLALGRLGVPGVLMMAASAGVPYVLVGAGGFAFAPAAHGGVLICCSVPLATAVLARIFLGERFTRLRLAGYGLILAAAAVLLVQAGSHIDGQVIIGDAMFLVAAVMWGGYTVMARRFGLDPLHTTAIVAVVSAVLYLPVYVVFLKPGLDTLPWSSIAMQVGGQGILTSIISLLSFSTAIRLIGASRTSALTALVPAGAMLLAIPVLGEWPGRGEILGVALGMAGVALASGALALPRGKKGVS